MFLIRRDSFSARWNPSGRRIALKARIFRKAIAPFRSTWALRLDPPKNRYPPAPKWIFRRRNLDPMILFSLLNSNFHHKNTRKRLSRFSLSPYSVCQSLSKSPDPPKLQRKYVETQHFQDEVCAPSVSGGPSAAFQSLRVSEISRNS